MAASKKGRPPSWTNRVLVSLPDEVYKKLKSRADAKGLALAAEARSIICQAIGREPENQKEDEMQIEKISDNFYEVLGAPIRGYDWKMVRKPGVGTYAIIAGEDEGSDDDEVVIEEYSAPENRATWDRMSVIEAAGASYRELKKITA